MTEKPDLIALIDQAVAESTQIARVAGALFHAYLSEGFTREEALHLVATFTKTIKADE